MSFGFTYYVGIVILIGSALLEAMAVPGLFKRSMSAWKLMFYSTLVSFIGTVVQGSVLGGILSLLIGMYLLFQVKEKYR